MQPPGSSIIRFHEGTKHPHGDLFNPHHLYDPSHRPPREKPYRKGNRIELHDPPPAAITPALTALVGGTARREPAPTNLDQISAFLKYSSGVTKVLKRGVLGHIPFRAAACTGALYHIELYLAHGGIEGLEAGLFAYQPESHELILLRRGDPRSSLARIAGGQPRILNSSLTVVYTSDYWRNATKYQARAYRHAFWDGGTVLANSLALAGAYGWPSEVILGFADHELERLLGIGDRPEVPLFMLSLGEVKGTPPKEEPGKLEAAHEPIHGFQIRWPGIESAHQATSLADPKAVESWRNSSPSPLEMPASPDSAHKVTLPDLGADLPEEGIEAVIKKRGSSRRFQQSPISLHELSVVLKFSTGEFPSTWITGSLLQPTLIIHEVEGIEPGAYTYRREDHALLGIRKGDFRGEAGHLALGQTLGSNASVNLYFLSDLDWITRRFGERGYRAAALAGGLAGGRGYLSAYALGLGATGLTFFDDAVIDFFDLHDSGMEVMFLLAVGLPG